MSENRTRFRLDQRRAPIYEALERFRQMRVVPFDVPGHKRGRGNPELTAFLGQQCVGVDVNSMKPLDNLCHPVSVIREAEELAADAFGAAHAFLMVGGTTSSVQSMVLTACKRGDEIILPRNVHRSVLNALVLCGAVPVYVNPEVDKRLGISLGMKREQVEKAIKEHPNAVAVLVNNPTYYGICSDLRAIVKMAHDAGMLCLADEAHGTHFYFGNGLPVSARAAGADMASVSMHKSGGSLTQSSLLLIGPNVHPGYVRQINNLGPVNQVAMEEYEQLKRRADYIEEQLADLESARKALTKITVAIDRKMRKAFLVTFEKVDANFREIFAMLFPGGQAHLEMTDPEHPAETGIEVVAQPRGKRITKMMLMSGGEKSLTALALLFAVYRTRTVPFYVLDEVEAALDDANLSKLIGALDVLRSDTQLLVISHQRRTMEDADVLYGVSMQADGVSRVVSQKLDRETGKVVNA